MKLGLPFGVATEVQCRTQTVCVVIPQREVQAATLDFDAPVIMNSNDFHLHDRLSRLVRFLRGCPAVLPDIEHYADCMDVAFAELLGSRTTESSVQVISSNR